MSSDQLFDRPCSLGTGPSSTTRSLFQEWFFGNDRNWPRPRASLANIRLLQNVFNHKKRIQKSKRNGLYLISIVRQLGSVKSAGWPWILRNLQSISDSKCKFWNHPYDRWKEEGKGGGGTECSGKSRRMDPKGDYSLCSWWVFKVANHKLKSKTFLNDALKSIASRASSRPSLSTPNDFDTMYSVSLENWSSPTATFFLVSTLYAQQLEPLLLALRLLVSWLVGRSVGWLAIGRWIDIMNSLTESNCFSVATSQMIRTTTLLAILG